MPCDTKIKANPLSGSKVVDPFSADDSRNDDQAFGKLLKADDEADVIDRELEDKS